MSTRRKNQIIVPEEPSGGPPIWVDILLLFIAPPFSTFAGLYFLFKQGKKYLLRQQYRDFRRYAAIIGDRGYVSIRELATRMNRSPDQVATELQYMIDQGMIDGQAYIDHNAMILYLQDDVIETEFVNPSVGRGGRRSTAAQTIPVEVRYAEPEPEKVTPQKQPAPEPAAPARPKEPPKPKPTGVDNEDFEAKLREIRKLNEEIENDIVSQRIDRIGALTASIFRVVREKPERADEVRKFMNYYLPTTMKLLKSYSLMEKQSYQGENIAASRKKIEDVLETLVHAFEQQQDRLFQSEAMDVETDISVLETMMASDGLTRQSQGLHL